jgi:hypothetical protein
MIGSFMEGYDWAGEEEEERRGTICGGTRDIHRGGGGEGEAYDAFTATA